MGVCGPETNTDLTRISLAARQRFGLVCPSDVHIPAVIGCDPQTLLSDGPPIGWARVSTLAQKAATPLLRWNPRGKEQDEPSNDNLCTGLPDATVAVFAPAQLKHGGSICRTENAVNNSRRQRQC